jgi:hypothetical protein
MRTVYGEPVNGDENSANHAADIDRAHWVRRIESLPTSTGQQDPPGRCRLNSPAVPLRRRARERLILHTRSHIAAWASPEMTTHTFAGMRLV